MKPEWLKTKVPKGKGIQEYLKVKQTLTETKLNTVCTEAKCPNLSECWSKGTATFMIMGNVCTRNCRFCSVESSKTGKPLNLNEPQEIARAVSKLDLNYAVITSVTRDDLTDYGSSHFKECVKAIKEKKPKVTVELLVPDFNGNKKCLNEIIECKAEVIGHNIETVKRLQETVRDRKASYTKSLKVLKHIKRKSPETLTKSSLMLGLGEKEKEVLNAMRDLRKAGVDFITLGQYLQPTPKQLKVKEFISPAKFKYYEKKAKEKGFFVVAGPLVRSSYHSRELFTQKTREKNDF
jgi:lipoic acid synthetase